MHWDHPSLVEPVVTNTGYYRWLLATGTIYTTHSTPIKSKASSLTPGLCEHFYWINALKSSEVCFTSRRRFSTCAQSLVVYYVIRLFFNCFPFILLLLKLYVSFILPVELEKRNKRRSFVRSIVLFLFFGRRQGEILSPLSPILFINYEISVCKPDFCVRFHLLSGYIRFTSSVDPEKNMLRDVNI